MPEEKVSKPFGETVADIRNSYVQTAADAGPRQPDAAERAAVKIVVECCEGVSDRNLGDYVANVSEMIRKEFGVPPVPQEAAPRLPSGLSKGAGYKTLGAFPVPCATNSSEPATAPDGAMRVAEQIIGFYMDGTSPEKPFNAENVAALIRQAGSERGRLVKLEANLGKREQELEETLRWLLPKLAHPVTCMKCLPAEDWHQSGSWVVDECKCGIAEASRLLGGES